MVEKIIHLVFLVIGICKVYTFLSNNYMRCKTITKYINIIMTIITKINISSFFIWYISRN